MKRKEYKKQLVLIPSAYNHKVMGDVENFIKYYKDRFDIYIICDKYEDEKVEEGSVKYINKNSFFAQYLRLTADYIIDAGSINGTTRISKTQKRISVWHGIPYKNMFVDLDTEYYHEALEYCYGIDLMISPSKFYSDRFLRNSMLYSGEILETAVSRTDSLFLKPKEKEKIKEDLNIPKDKKVLLYAPTFRKEGDFYLPFEPQQIIESLPSDEWVIVTKLHYLNTLKNKNDVIDCTEYPIVNNLLAIADLLVTDYSSLFFDYSVLDKPAIFYQYDKNEYEQDRGFMFELTDYVDEKYIVTSEEDFYNLLNRVDEIKHNLKRIKKEFYPYQKENSTESLVQKLSLDDTPRKTKEIIFLVNDLNQIGGIHNFVLNLAKEFKEKYNSKIIVIGKNEFAKTNEKMQFFDKDNLIDIKLSKEKNPYLTKYILTNTDGYIIGCQFGAFMSMQQHLKNKKAILMFHGDTEDIVTRNYYATHLDTVNNYLVDNYKKFVLLTKGNMDTLAKYVNNDIKEKLTYIENGFDFKDRKNYYKKNGEFVCVTRLDDDKNPYDIIEIFKDNKLNNNYKVHVYGDGALKKEFENKIKELKLEDKIILHGYCSNKDEIYKDKQGLVMTSLTEGFPYIILEAYKYGIPVYSYDSFTSASDLVNDSIGSLIETGNINHYVYTLNNAKNAENKCFDSFIKKFSNETIIKKWLDLFDELDSEKEELNTNEQVVKTPSRKLRHPKIKKSLIKKKLLKSNSLFTSNLYIELTTFKFKIKKLLKREKEPLVSIIMPFYNNNDTLKRALNSIKKSGYKNYEVIVVNDGSSDNPKDIIDKFKKVKYFYKENEGCGLARNFGIDKASGKYVFFLDSDDEICKYSLNIMVDYAKKEKLDVVCGLCRRVYFKTKNTSYWFPSLYRKRIVNTLEERERILEDSISTSKLYNLEKIKEANIKFASGLYEDVLFMAEIYMHFDKIGFVPNVAYTWYIYGKGTSITTTMTMDNIRDRLDKHDRIMNISLEHYKVYYMKNFVTHHMYVLINNFNIFSKSEQKEIYNLIRNHLLKHKYYIYERLIYMPEKKYILNLILEDNYKEFLKIATLASQDFLNKLKKLSNEE